jgi:hypothetical protein
MKIAVNAIADQLDACRCRSLEVTLDAAGETIADHVAALAAAESEVVRLRDEVNLQQGIGQALADSLREVMRERDAAILERDVAQQEAAGMFGVPK